jgi:hypothetical protein
MPLASLGIASMTTLTRRSFLKSGTLVTGVLLTGVPRPPALIAAAPGASSKGALALLPAGNAPRPVELPHFPDRLHAFIWRNWGLVPPERLAAVVGARPSDLVRLGRAMGLSGPPRVTPDQCRRSYITLIRRNWHLLPYEQLLALLGWTAEQLAFTLREDDFLFIKLGSHKPACTPLAFAPPNPAAMDRARAIARLLREDLPEPKGEIKEPLFQFVSRLSAAPDRPALPAGAAGTTARGPRAPLRFCYSYFALYGDPLLETEADPYPQGLLARLAAAGVNGVWLQAVLHKLAPFPWQPELSAHHEERLSNLRALVARAGRYGIRIWLYLNEPRALPLAFFETRAGLKGVVEGDHATLCTSHPQVQAYLVKSVASICRAVPGLGGFFTITGSENLTHCWSHGGGARCPRCGARPAAEVTAEVNRLIWDGLRKGSPTAPRENPKDEQAAPGLIAWDWGWNDDWAPDCIARLPAGVSLMSVSEWGLPIDRGGVKSAVGEYSISAVGPGPRATRHWGLARQRGLGAIAKIQAGNSWELSAVPYIPALANVARHASNLRQAGVDGLMLGWTLGGCPSPNLEVVAELGGQADLSPPAALLRVAERRVGRALAPALVTAWEDFSQAFSQFPFHIGVVYSAPLQTGPANLLWPEPTGYKATMVGIPYDDLDGWRAIYPPEVFIRQLETVAQGFEAALVKFKASARQCRLSKPERLAFEAELRVAEAAALHFQSVSCQARFVLARDRLRAATDTAATSGLLVELEKTVRQELDLARRLHSIQQRDSRIGFEASNQYYYVPQDLAEKILNCRHLLDTWLPAQRKRWNDSNPLPTPSSVPRPL